MTSKTLLIAKVLPFRQKDDKFIEIKVKNLGKLSENICEMNEEMIEKPKRKRERLDHLTHEEKIKRRKLHNRAAAQSARDRKKLKMNELIQNINCLTKQKSQMESNNQTLITRCKALEKENRQLKERLSQMEMESKSVEENQRFVESAELINVSQPQKHESQSRVHHSMTPLIYWLAIMNAVMKSSNSSTTVLNNFSTQISSTTVHQKNQMLPQLTTTTVSSHNWIPSKT